jgi:ABC-2 type transport system ATP-binding protein
VDPLLQVTDARRRFGDRTALDGASFHVASGEWIGLLGPNGAGKTTLVRSITGRVRLDAGTVTLGDTVIVGDAADPADRAAAARRRLGLVPQELAILPLLTARENLTTFARLHGLTPGEARERTKWALAFTGLADRADEPARGFSGGMKRRLNLACGVLHRPEIVLLDEPTVGVDPQSRERIWTMLGELQDAGTALLLTTHQLDEAQRVCRRIVVIDRGTTIADGTFDELVAATVGRGRAVRLRLRGIGTDAAQNASRDAAGERQSQVERHGDELSLTLRTENVAEALPPVLARLAAAGATVEDVSVEAPTLQGVFLHLTGRELRE